MNHSSRSIGRSIGAVLTGIVAGVALTLATDMVLHAIGFFPPPGQPASDGPLVVATAYRIVYGIAGSYITAMLAPNHPMRHALAGGVAGFVVSAIGAVVTWNRSAVFGPHWYPLALVVTAIPCAWVGGRLREMQLRPN
jgi:hypothetical protein